MATAAKPPGPSAVRWRRKLCFALLPLAALLLLAEVGLRLARSRQGRGSFWSASFREQRLALVRASYPVAPDPQLGYVPRPNAVSSANRWGALVSIDAHGLRQPGQQPSRTDCVGVLAVGDSFTFGDQVSDGDTWPAQLEQRLQVPVWNAGVFGYSFAQAVLRAELLLPRLPVGALVVSFIADDLRRCELSQRYTAIPWYDLVDGQLVLRPVPVPDATAGAGAAEPWLQRALGTSALLDYVAWNAFPAWWVGDQREVRAHPPGTGLVIARLLLARLQANATARGVPLHLVLQGTEPHGDAAALLQHARSLAIPVLDLASAVHAEGRQDPLVWQRYFAGHMTPAGNAWVATKLAAWLPPIAPAPVRPR
jgi:hypothetical protein